MDLHFESFAAGFVDVWRLHNGESAALSRQRHRTRDGGAGANRGVNDLFGALVDNTVVVGLEADTNL